MHLKEAYQRRIKQQKISAEKPSKHIDYSTIIGSIHTGNINFDQNEPFFIDYKMPTKVKQAKQYIKVFKDPDIMQTRKKSWNTSVASPRKFDDFQKEESHQTKLLKIKVGLSDFVEFKQKGNKTYQGTQTRDSFSGWNVSTYVDKQQKNKGILNTNLNAFDNSIKYNTTHLLNYKTLSSRYNETNNLNKSELNNNSDIIQDLKKSFLFYHPGSSPQRTNANGMKMYDQIKRQELQRQIKAKSGDSYINSFKANLSPTQKIKIKYKYYHNGKWQKNSKKLNQIKKKNKADDSEQQNEQGYAWSCCMNSSKDSRGCSYRVQDGNRMNLSSFNHQ